MIDYIKYTVDGMTYELTNNNDGTWGKELNAPDVAGRYDLLLEIGQGEVITYIDSSDSRYDLFLYVISSAERVVFLERYVPEFIGELEEFAKIYNTENLELDKVYALIEKTVSDMFITTASNESIIRIEDFLRIKGLGSLEQRKSYLISLLGAREKLNENSIKEVTNIIAGADCIVTFFSSDEINNPYNGFGYLRVQVLSPNNQKNYRYEDIERALRPSIPSHIKLSVIKYFATWKDTLDSFNDWSTVTTADSWQAIKNYIPNME